MLKETVSIKEAKKIISEAVTTLPFEEIDTVDSLGRHVFETIKSPLTLPSYDTSAMDGFAVISSDLKSATKENPIILSIVDEVYAGKYTDSILESGNCVRIFTGANIPKGADAVVRQEDVEYENGKAVFKMPVERGTDIRTAGDDVMRGQVILKQGDLISSSAIGLLTALNISKIKVFLKPKIYILATGNELVDIGSLVPTGKIINSNSYSLASMTKECNAIPIYGGIANDNEETISMHFENAIKNDIVITTGGVSVGKYDLVKDAFEKKGVKWLFWKVKIRPGHPIAFGIFEKTLFFGLPGNPVSSMVTFDQFVRPAILKMMGVENTERMRFYASSTVDIKKKPDRTHFLRAKLSSVNGELFVEPIKNQSSAAISTMIEANCYIILEEGKTKIEKGEKVLVELFKS